MRVVLQRVRETSVVVDGGEPRSIGPGLLLLLGVKEGDSFDVIPKLAKKCANMRIFTDEEGKMNLSAVQLGYSAMVVSNFTLHADTQKGMRPSFVKAAGPQLAKTAYDLFLEEMAKQGLKDVQHGEFGADMQITLVNDGPVTIVVDTEEWSK